MIRRLAGARSRRSLVGGSLASAVLMALGWGQEAGAKKRTVRAADKLGIGARCDPPNKDHGKKHGCGKCRTGYSVQTTNGKGKTIRKCACKPVGEPSSRDKQWQCCSGLSDGSRCVNSSTAAPLSCGAGCPVCFRCNQATNQCEVNSAAVGLICGDGQTCQANGACVCSEASCGPCRTCEANGTCQVCEPFAPCNAGVCADSCEPVVTAGPPAQATWSIEDEDGLAEILVTRSENADTVVPPFTVGTTNPVVMTATKIDQTRFARVEFLVTDMRGNVRRCETQF
jgi:hypothetical protein